MRIIRGTHKGRRIHVPGKLPVRPTTDLAKESLFNILENSYYTDEITVLDLFAGTGGISYEFASRGSIEVVAVDMNPKCVKFIQETAKTFKFSQIRTVKENVRSFLHHAVQKFDIIFADPPYDLHQEDLDNIIIAVFEKGLLKENGSLIIEHGKDKHFDHFPELSELRKYGQVHFSFFGYEADKSHTFD